MSKEGRATRPFIIVKAGGAVVGVADDVVTALACLKKCGPQARLVRTDDMAELGRIPLAEPRIRNDRGFRLRRRGWEAPRSWRQ
jgi:hypothetical protein